MMVIGIDAHKRSHTAVTVDEMGRQGFVKTVGTTTQDHLRLLKWAVGLAEERLWAIEDCRHLTRRLERDLIAAGESVVRVSPKLMAHVRDSARSYGKSDPIVAVKPPPIDQLLTNTACALTLPPLYSRSPSKFHDAY